MDKPGRHLVNPFLFKHRDGQTPIPPDYFRSLIPKSIQNFQELDEQEEQNIALGISWLEKQKGDPFDHLFWRNLHRELFYKVWTWAGKTRRTELQNEEFFKVFRIEDELKKLQGDAKFWFDETEMSTGEGLARFHERMLTIHPFPNGNGRFTRVLSSHICSRYNLPIPTWGQQYVDQNSRRDTYINAVKTARANHSFAPLIAFIYG
ncbi:MAG: mobile mystery protein B [Proteobacteria bacterium]|nr:MAG: mobile mystery protein B [Pseudomonadota bacterium]